MPFRTGTATTPKKPVETAAPEAAEPAPAAAAEPVAVA
jgi:hypothetical protein